MTGKSVHAEAKGSGEEGPVRAVLFDLDGVLIDSYEAWFHVVTEAAVELSAAHVSREKFASLFGQGISADLKDLYPGRTREEVEGAYVRAMARQTSTIRVNSEAVALLADLGRRGVRRACVTNTQIGLARTILEASGLASGFDDVQGVRVGIREKPAPDLLVAALEALRVAPSDALMVGDSRYDEMGAAAAEVPFLHYDLKSGASLGAAITSTVAKRAGRG